MIHLKNSPAPGWKQVWRNDEHLISLPNDHAERLMRAIIGEMEDPAPAPTRPVATLLQLTEALREYSDELRNLAKKSIATADHPVATPVHFVWGGQGHCHAGILLGDGMVVIFNSEMNSLDWSHAQYGSPPAPYNTYHLREDCTRVH